MKHELIPRDWSTWGEFPKLSDKDLHTYNVIWRAFSPDQSFIIEVKWRPEQDPGGSMVCRLIMDRNWREPMYESKPSRVGELITAVEKIVGSLPDPSVVKQERTKYAANTNERTSSLEASLVTKRQKRKYTKKAARWVKKSASWKKKEKKLELP